MKILKLILWMAIIIGSGSWVIYAVIQMIESSWWQLIVFVVVAVPFALWLIADYRNRMRFGGFWLFAAYLLGIRSGSGGCFGFWYGFKRR